LSAENGVLPTRQFVRKKPKNDIGKYMFFYNNAVEARFVATNSKFTAKLRQARKSKNGIDFVQKICYTIQKAFALNFAAKGATP